MKRIIFFFVILTNSINVFSASFDCSKNLTKIESFICGDKELSEKDVKLNELYQHLATRDDNRWTRGLKRIQWRWLEIRNSVGTDKDSHTWMSQKDELAKIYDDQISRLDNMDGIAELIDLASAAVQDIYIKAIDDYATGPYDIERLENGLYMYGIGGVPREQGIWLYNPANRAFISIAGSEPSIKHEPTKDFPYFILEEGGMHEGLMWSTYNVVLIDNKTLKVESKNLYTSESDGGSGTCDGWQDIGLEVNSELVGMTFHKAAKGYVIEFESNEEICKTSEITHKVYKYTISENRIIKSEVITKP